MPICSVEFPGWDSIAIIFLAGSDKDWKVIAAAQVIMD